ncbi:MAG: RNA polymerase sigma factor RpoD/SigA [Opitutaceae bacterium]|jgi:RNA polymerase primary sigma factor|nr:RNA polymerase sigma factor RpoD/SigA [Opitutaceae bacterium]
MRAEERFADTSDGFGADTAGRFAASEPDGGDAPEEPSDSRGNLTFYLRRIRRTPLLAPEEEVLLARRIRKGDKAARDHMISANLRLVVKIAMDYRDFGLPLPDLISEGNLGLIKAVGRFDPSKGGRLSTYGAWWIKQYIKRALANQSKTIRLPVHLLDKISRMRRASARLSEELGREPTDEELAGALGVRPARVAHLKSVSVHPASLDAPVGEGRDAGRFGELIGDERAASPLESLVEGSEADGLLRMIGELEPREAEIIRLRFGFGGADELTLEEIGARFNVTRERVRQLQNQALGKLRRALEESKRQLSAEEVRADAVKRGRMRVLREFVRGRGG